MEHLDTYNLILKLGRLGAYDSSRRIRGKDGTFVPNTDIAHLIEEAMRPSRVVNGAEDFIDLLVASKIDPDSIVNDTLRSKLVQRIEQQRHQQESSEASDGDDTIIYSESDVNPEPVRRPVVRLQSLDSDNNS